MTQSTRPIHALAAAVACLLPAAAWAAGSGAADARVDAMALYNQGAAVVQDTLEMQLDEGEQSIAWPVNGRLRAQTLWLEGKGVRLTGFDATARPDRRDDPLAARVGLPVTLVRNGRDGGLHRREATLVGLHGDSVLVRIDDRIERITADAPWWITWPVGSADSDADADTAGALQLDISADAAGSKRLTATYQIDGPSWQASYTGRFDPHSGELSLQSMAVIDNSGGVRLAADRVWLVAGDVARTNGHGPQPMMMARSQAKMSDSAPQAAGDTYHYALDGPLDVPAGGIRAVSMMDPVSFAAKRSYHFENSWYASTSEDARSHAEVRLAFSNSSDKPLPAGAVRIYDGQHQAQLMGEDGIGDTPKGAPVVLILGRSFDVTGMRRIVSDDTNEAKQHSREIQLKLYNAGKDDAPVDVIEHLPEAADIVSASIDQSGKAPANTGTWHIDVPAQGQAQLTYTVRWPARG